MRSPSPRAVRARHVIAGLGLIVAATTAGTGVALAGPAAHSAPVAAVLGQVPLQIEPPPTTTTTEPPPPTTTTTEPPPPTTTTTEPPPTTTTTAPAGPEGECDSKHGGKHADKHGDKHDKNLDKHDKHGQEHSIPIVGLWPDDCDS